MASSSGMPVDTIVGAGRMVEVERGDGDDAQAAVVDHERVLVGAVARAPLLDDPDAAHRDLVVDPVVEGDHAVGHVLLEPVAGEGALAPLGGDDGGDAPGLEPGEEPAQLGPELGGVVEGREEHLDGVEHDPLGAHLVDGEADPDEQGLQVVVAGLVDALPLDLDVVDDELAVGAQRRRGPSRGRRRWRSAPRPSPRRRRTRPARPSRRPARGTRRPAASCRSPGRRPGAWCGPGAGRRR